MFEQMAPIFIPLMASRFEQEYDKFMALSEADRNKELDMRIDEMAKRGGPGAGGGRPAGVGAADGPTSIPRRWTNSAKRCSTG